MTRPRIFISSTFYDLKHIRASLDNFIQNLGFDTILSEKGNIAYAFDRPLDESCYAEVGSADMFVLIVGGRYGSAASDQEPSDEQTFYDRYISITRKEYDRAAELDLPIYVLVDKGVLTELGTYRANRANQETKYAHVDSVNIFIMLDEILNLPRNNATLGFERFSDIEEWLREQWAGLFRDLLKRTSQQAQLRTLGEQVSEMTSINQTLKAYMEKVVDSVAPAESKQLIDTEDKRRARQKELMDAAETFRVIRYISEKTRLSTLLVMRALEDAPNMRQFVDAVQPVDLSGTADGDSVTPLTRLGRNQSFVDDLNEVRTYLGLSSWRRLPSPRSRAAAAGRGEDSAAES